MAAGILVGFLLGLLSLLAAEAAALLWVVRRLRRRQDGAAAAAQPDAVEELPGERPFPYEKKGSLWILEPEKLPKVSNERLSSGGLKETKDKKSIVEVFPAKKMAKIKGHSLILSGPDGSETTIELLNCMVVAVSASSMPSRKWTKRYPIKLESQESEIYNGSKVCFLYAETSWEKESWCKALRLAATADKEKLNWHAKLSKEFSNYISSLNSEYPCFLKPTVLSAEDHEVMDSEIKTDGSSKVRLFLKKLAKKASTKVPAEGKTNVGSSTQGEKKMLDKIRSYQGAPFIEALIGPQEDKFSSSSSHDTTKPSAPIPPLSSHAGQLPAFPDVNADDKVVDEGTLCWNLLSSRLFFDAKMNDEINKFIKARIQKTFSSMRTPAYVGEITLTDFSLGKLPPYVHALRVLPLDLNELWAFEVDFEYSGGILLHIETRLEVEEPELQKDLMKTNFGTDSNGEVDSELLDSIEQYGNQFRGSQNSDSSMEEKEEADASQSKSTGWTSTYISRLKNMLHSIADHVSQVPLSLAIKITSVRGVLRVHLKPPPSDQLWYGFTSMPHLEWDLESSVGDRKITNNRIASLIGNRIKASLRDTLVLPNCESISLPWMVSEKDDWVPLKDGPYIWLNHEPTETRSHAAASVPAQPEEAAGPKADASTKNPKADTSTKTPKADASTKNPKADASSKSAAPSSRDSSAGSEDSLLRSIDESAEDPPVESSHAQSRFSPAGETSTSHPDSTNELRKPLLSTEKLQEDASESRPGSPMYTSLRAIIPAGEQQQQQQPQALGAASVGVGDDGKRKSGRRSLLDLRKKVGDKLEEKRRQVEEKGRHIVEKMRENARTNIPPPNQTPAAAPGRPDHARFNRPNQPPRPASAWKPNCKTCTSSNTAPNQPPTISGGTDGRTTEGGRNRDSTASDRRRRPTNHPRRTAAPWIRRSRSPKLQIFSMVDTIKAAEELENQKAKHGHHRRDGNHTQGHTTPHQLTGNAGHRQRRAGDRVAGILFRTAPPSPPERRRQDTNSYYVHAIGTDPCFPHSADATRAAGEGRKRRPGRRRTEERRSPEFLLSTL